MTSPAPVESWSWTRARWWAVIACIFGLQLGLILWLGDRAPIRPRLPAAAPVLYGPFSGSAELLALSDPTVFARPHPQGFSGLAWLLPPQRQFSPFHWPDQPEELSLPLQQLGAAFNQFLQTNYFKALTLPEAVPDLNLPAPAPLKPGRERSEFRVEGGLAGRKLLSTPALRSWPHTNLLANSTVQIVVGAEGRPISLTLLPPGSGYPDADQYALAQARAARFEPASGGGKSESATNVLAGLTWGRMTFEWHTLPLPLTNTIPATTK